MSRIAGRGLAEVVRWYLREQYGCVEGPGTLPFYCDPERVGFFAVAARDLAAGDEAAVFRVFVTLAMYQALRDVVIMNQQRGLPLEVVQRLADVVRVQVAMGDQDCWALRAGTFERSCDVLKDGRGIDCTRAPGLHCHVKDATAAFNRMGDMGKLPSSAWLRIWKEGGSRKVLADVCREEQSPSKRADLLVERFASVHRVGRKLATMFVSALSTPALAPGLTPWFPEIDGNELVVVDTNVARAVDALRPGASKTYDARAGWLRDQAARVDLREFRPDVPSYSPRLVQQALYAFCSKSNRVARGDPCAATPGPCEGCAPTLCPFVPAPAPRHRTATVGRSLPDAAP